MSEESMVNLQEERQKAGIVGEAEFTRTVSGEIDSRFRAPVKRVDGGKFEIDVSLTSGLYHMRIAFDTAFTEAQKGPVTPSQPIGRRLRQPDLLRLVRRVLIAHRFEPSRVKTGWHKHNGRGGGGYTDPGFKLEGDHGAVLVRHWPNYSIDHWEFERNERMLEKYVEALQDTGFSVLPQHLGGPRQAQVGWRGGTYAVPPTSLESLNLSCIERRITELRQDEQQSLRGSLNATTTASHQWWQDQLRHERYLLKLLGAT